MSTCARCGLEANADDLTLSGTCPGVDVLACRDRQIAAQAALLRSVTRRLEFASEFLSEHHYDPPETAKARAEIDAVLEVLS